MSLWKEFKAFLSRGSVLDLAVGFIVGSAFSGVVKSLVDNVIMPPIGLLLGAVDFGELYAVLKAGQTPGPYATLQAANDAGAVTWRYGLFINSVVNFVIVAVAIFLIVKAMGRLMPKKEEAAAAPTTKACPFCQTEIPIAAKRCPHCTSHLE